MALHPQIGRLFVRHHEIRRSENSQTYPDSKSRNGGPHPLTQTTIFNHAINEEWRLDNPAGNSLDTSLPHRSKVVVHHRSLPYAHVPEAMSKVREYLGEPASRLGLEFLVHTAARVGEVCFATWEEIDLDNRTWTVPGPRLKARLRHRVPLSQRALVVLAEARETVSEDGIIFQNPKTGRCLPDAAFGEGGPAALIFEQSGGSPPPSARRSRRS